MPPAHRFDPEKITFFAKTDARGQAVPFGIKAKDRQRHMYVVGKTGMGKSTLLENMAAQDIMSGEGMAFIDPHGSAAETLLEYIPEERVQDVIYFAPFDLDHPISFNVMEDVGPDKRHLVVSGLMSTFKKIWVDAWSARMEYILTNALLALIEYPDTTLLSVNRLFIDKGYRDRVVDYVKDPAVKSFWKEEFANYTDRFAAEALPAIQNKIGQFTGNPLIRNIIGQPHSSFDIRQIMDERKILIMNLSKGLIGETNANLLGSMLTTRIYLAAMSRADLSVDVMKTMPNFYFYVDEFQSFANATFANILSEARKYHLNLIIAHQYITQMEEEVKDAVFGNVGTTLAFRVGPFDAEVLETVFAPRFMATDLVNLGFAQVYLTLMIDGIGSPPFSAQTLPPLERPHKSCREMVIAASRQHFAKPRTIVEQVVNELHNPVEPTSTAIDKNNRQFEPPAERERRLANKAAKQAEKNERRAAKRMEQVEAPAEAATAQASGSERTRVPEARAKARASDAPAQRDTTRTEAASAPARPAWSGHAGDNSEARQRADQAEAHLAQPERRPDARPTDKRKSPKSKSGEQSLADLRSVLASISAQSGGGEKKPAPKPKPAPPQDAPATAAKPASKSDEATTPAKPSDTTANVAPTPAQPAPAPASTDTPARPATVASPGSAEASAAASPLKDALAAAVSDVSFATSPVAPAPTADQNPPKPAAAAQSTASDTAAPAYQSPETEPAPAPSPSSEMVADDEPIITPLPDTDDASTPTPESASVAQERDELAAMAAEADAMFADLEAREQTNQSTPDAGISKQAVKRILNGGNDRSPFV